MTQKICLFCRFSKPAEGLDRPILICNHKLPCRNKWFVVRPSGSCPNFKPKKSLVSIPHPAGTSLIPLSLGKFAIVDTEDYPFLNRFSWYAAKHGLTYYAFRKHNGRTISMHRLIINAPPNLLCDHIDRNGLNNSRANLRLCTPAQNSYNRKRTIRKSSKYKGVYRLDSDKKWRARLYADNRRYYFGPFDNPLEAAKAYDIAAMKYHGDFACLNFPKPKPAPNRQSKIIRHCEGAKRLRQSPFLPLRRDAIFCVSNILKGVFS